MEGAGNGSFFYRCRLCISEGRLSLNLFETEAIRLNLINKIRTYLTIHVSLHDGLPQQLCYECLSQIELFHSYKQSCLESQYTLKHWNLFCDGGELKEDNVLNVNVTSNVLEDDDDNRQATEAVRQSSFSGDQLPEQKGYMNSPKSRYSKCCKRSPKTSEHFEMEGNSVGDSEFVCEMIDLIQNPRKAYSGPLTFPDSTFKQSEVAGDSIEGNGVECELGEISELKDKFSCTVAKCEPSEVGLNGWNESPLSVLCISKEVPRQNCAVLSRHNVETSAKDQRTELNAPVNHFGLNVPTEGSSHTCMLIQTPLKAAADTVLTFPDSTPKEFEGEEISVVGSEIQSEAVETSARDTEVSFFSTAVKHERRRVRPKRRNICSLYVPCNSKEVSSNTPLHEQNSETSALHRKVRAGVTGMNVPTRRPSIMSPVICDIRSLASIPDSVAEECGTDHCCSHNIEDSEKTTWLTEQERKVTASENVAINSQKQNESIHISLNSDHERHKYQSVQVLLKVLEPGEDSNSFESDIENTRVRKMLTRNMCRPAKPGRRGGRRNNSTEHVIKDPLTAYVKVERLAENKKGTAVDVQSKIKNSTAVSTQAKKPRRPYSQKQKSQSSQYRLVKPVSDEATGKLRYKCLKCSSLLSYKHCIKEHMKIHTGDKSSVCAVCNLAFRNNYMLKSHMVVHLAEKNFECEVCKHRFLGGERRKQHMRLHTVTPFVCQVCGYSCNLKDSLKHHMRIHTGERPYKCDLCDAAFSVRTTWINHRRIHTGERPFKCKECNKTFSRHSTLHAHKRTHSDVRVFGCHLCVSRFKAKAHLLRHLSCVHKDLMKKEQRLE